ncbi:restriction endonuclease subunit S [Streptomyces hygroscopicus]|uniref:restriction endonuclease subunit S n=1 Tax=Streptomyces hygroscopicus TaxID=1912 RepID=UPI00379EC8C9
MSSKDFPDSWVITTLDEIAEINMGQSPPGTAYNVDGNGLPFFQGKAEFGDIYPTVQKWTTESGKVAEQGDILLSVRAPVGPTNLAPSQCAIGRGLASIRARSGISQQYLLHALRATTSTLAAKATGSTFTAVSGAIVRAHKIPLPPLAEQDRIVAALEGHLSRLNAAQSWLGLAQENSLRLESLLCNHTVAGAFSRPVRVDEAPQVDEIRRASSSRATRRWKPTTTSTISGYTPPDNWTMVSLGDLSYASGYGTSTKCDYSGAGRPVLRIPNVQDGSINLSDLKRAIDPSLDLAHYSLEPGDLLFVRTNGSRKLIGRVGVVEESLPHAFASYLIRFRLTPGIVEPRWVQLVTQSPLWRQTLERYAASSAGQYNLSAETLSHLPVPVPPLAVQRETLEVVSAALDRVTRLSAATELATARGKHLRGALLNRALTGRLVPQDPADEPASVLLDRIRAEREAQSRSGKGRRAPRRPRKATTDASPPPPPSTTSIPAPTNAVQQELPL